MTEATAPGKIILFGEHAVVYGRPAIAAPLMQVRAEATVEASDGMTLDLWLPDLGERYQAGLTWAAVSETTPPLLSAVRYVQRYLGGMALPALRLTVRSAIPIAGGLGSGAATAAALIRALLRHLGDSAENATVCDLTYAVECLHHGTPSGIDNTVVSYEQPVFFLRRPGNNLVQPFITGRPLHLIIGDTGVRSETKGVVADVRRQWQADPATFEMLFDRCGHIAHAAHAALAEGDPAHLGRLMNENQRVLQAMTVSNPALERLIEAALRAGALGAKLSGAGRGGNMIALVTPEQLDPVEMALRQVGAVRTWRTSLG